MQHILTALELNTFQKKLKHSWATRTSQQVSKEYNQMIQ